MQAGGKMDRGETPFQTLARELTEELEFTPDEDESRFLGTFFSVAANEPDHVLEAHLFHIRATDQMFSAGAELEAAIWVSVEEANQLQLAPFTRDHVLPLAAQLRI
jgi:8-oxo-dGTP pyrophosphatase MutT (NUDIX family)